MLNLTDWICWTKLSSKQSWVRDKVEQDGSAKIKSSNYKISGK